MSADVVAAARGTLRDLDAALAAHEAAQAVAWLDLVWQRLQDVRCGCGCRETYEPRTALHASSDPDVMRYAATIANGSNHERYMAEVVVPPGVSGWSEEMLLWSEEPDLADAARWPWPAPSHDIRTRDELAADMGVPEPPNRREGGGYVVVQREGGEPVVYRAADVQVQREPWREALRETLLAELEQVNPEAAARHRRGPRTLADLGVEMSTSYVLTWARRAARMELAQRAELEEAMVRLRAIAGPDLTEEHAHRLLVAFAAISEPTRAAAFRSLLDHVAEGARIDWTAVEPSTFVPQPQWLFITPGVALSDFTTITAEERHP